MDVGVVVGHARPISSSSLTSSIVPSTSRTVLTDVIQAMAWASSSSLASSEASTASMAAIREATSSSCMKRWYSASFSGVVGEGGGVQAPHAGVVGRGLPASSRELGQRAGAAGARSSGGRSRR